MEKLTLNYTHGHQVAQIVLNASRGNILDSMMMKELNQLFGEFKSKNNLKLITLEGAGDHFSYGASVEEHRKEKAAEMLRTFQQLFYNLIILSIPTLAKVRGLCLGGALELTLMCHFIYADQSAKFGQPEIQLGVFAPPGSLLLPLKIGQSRADELLLTGKTITAQEAKSLGLVHELFSDKKELEKGVNNFIEKYILPRSASSLRFAVKAARAMLNEEITQKLPEMEKLYLNELMETNDANEGIQAFLEKRKPRWTNS